ncbi:MAG: hypothetical protein J1F04_02165 [Oscillospiraceae bacterium]|nr:hypothetical protein [Oscillospiraceae bacterium]
MAEEVNNSESKFLDKRSVQCAMSLLTVVFVAAYMPVFMVSANSLEVGFGEILMPLGVFIGIGLAVYWVMLFFTKSFFKAAINSSLVILLLENYHMAENVIRYVFPVLRYWHIIVILLVIVLHIDYLLYRLLKDDIAKIVSCITGLIFAALVLLNIITAVPNMISSSDIPDESGDTGIISGDYENDGANIYYFVLDEGASFPTLRDYYGYDAADLRKFLTDNNFTISDNSYNDSDGTYVVMANIFNLDYVVDLSMSSSEINAAVANPPLVQLLTRNGYEVVGVGASGSAGVPSVTADSSNVATTISGETFTQMLMDNTFLYPLYAAEPIAQLKGILNGLDYFDTCSFDVSSRFTYAHINSPHQPFYLDESGNLNSTSNFSNWEDPKYYLNYYRYTLGRVKTIVETIIANDPNSIIFITSDHGARSNPEIPAEEITHILQCIYYKGEPVSETEGLSGVNSLRVILQKQFGEDLPIVEVP